MATNTSERTALYLQQVGRLAQRNDLSVDEALEILTDRLLKTLRARLDDEGLTKAEKVEVLDAIMALTPSADELGLDEEQVLEEVNAERSEFNKQYFGVDLSAHVIGREFIW